MKNMLYYGDNLDILRRYIKDESIDLTYLDPPFKSGQDYNILFKERNGTQSSAQIGAFEDTWHWDRMAEDTYTEIVERLPKRIADVTRAFRSFLGTNDMMAYLVMMAIRLQELHRVLKPTGSIYLHCDPTASHYLKLVMDAVFGIKQFGNEIIWCYTGPSRIVSHFPRKHDVILRYSKSDEIVFNGNSVVLPYSKSFLERRRHREGVSGIYGGRDEQGKDLKKYQKGKVPEDWWIDIPSGGQISRKEHLGYPTQKPERLLERIIKASSNEGDVILDPFCGCGTTIAVAERLKRRWIGIDITHLAVSLMRHRLEDSFGEEVKYEVIGEPVDLRGAEELANQDPYQFQWWALGLVGARPAESEKKKGTDKGKDGYIYFHDDPKKSKTKTVIIQVKSGHVNRGMIDALKGVVEREEAQIGVFITLKKPTKPMKKEAISSGFYKSPLGHNYPKMQILTIKELLVGKGIERPVRTMGIDATFKRAERYKRENQQEEMEL